MTDFTKLSSTELKQTERQLAARYEEIKGRGLALDMTRGKPSPAQLDLSRELLSLPGPTDYKSADGLDCRNYGGLDGLPEMKALFAELLEVASEQVIIGGNGSLPMMHDAIVRAFMHGVPGGEEPWSKARAVKFLCPSPGYDRHFAICEHFGIEMVTVDMQREGPDMEAVERLVARDETVKGMWCVPKYSNPTGAIYADSVVERLAAMKTAATDFRILWDNAYAVHHLGAGPDPLANILRACHEAGNPNRVLVFGSTSKITFAGSGIAAMAASLENIEDAKRHLAIRTIGPDKLNQLRHLRFFGDFQGVLEHMEKHARILKPKFDAVNEIFTRELEGKQIADWTHPRGGYFISLDTMDGCAKEVVRLAAELGVKVTKAGATFPYGVDPHDRNIRIAPSLPALDEIRLAMEALAVCIQLASARKLLA